MIDVDHLDDMANRAVLAGSIAVEIAPGTLSTLVEAALLLKQLQDEDRLPAREYSPDECLKMFSCRCGPCRRCEIDDLLVQFKFWF